MLRVFARKTNACPDDNEAFFGPPIEHGNGEQVSMSCTFTYDKSKAERLAEQWSKAGYNVTCGGPAYDTFGGEFTPGLYLKRGIVITSRGCNNNCWFCLVPQRQGKLRELKITNGWNVMDDNLLQCSPTHIIKVFDMLKRQKHRPRFTGGLEAACLKDWHVSFLQTIKTERVYFAYDTSDDYEPLVVAAGKMRAAGFKYGKMSCYVLIGYPKDTISNAEKRLQSVVALGVMPFGMLWKNKDGDTDKTWRQFQRHWAAPIAVGAKMKAAGW